MILADIGNRHVHICKDDKVEHLQLDEALKKYSRDTVYYISVRSNTVNSLKNIDNWIDISDKLNIDGDYEGMGVDRKALCLSCDSGIFIDAGSAITVDRVTDGVYKGGFIIPGIHTYRRSFADISPILDHEIDRDISLDKLPKSTPHSVSYGTVAPIVAIVEKIRDGMPLYFTGGDGEWLSGYFDDAVYDEQLVFKGMIRKILELGIGN